MGRKLLGYSVLSFLSFCFFIFIFNTIANAKTYPINTFQFILPKPSATPTPTPAPTTTPTPTPTSTPTPETPTPEPTATPTPWPALSSIELETLFQKYSDEYAVAKDLLKRIANCESGFNSQADSGTYIGMFQFASQTWTNARNAMGLDPNPDLRKNSEESIRTAAFMIQRGQQNAWKNCL